MSTPLDLYATPVTYRVWRMGCGHGVAECGARTQPYSLGSDHGDCWSGQVLDALAAGGGVLELVPRVGESLPDGRCAFEGPMTSQSGAVAPADWARVVVPGFECWTDLGRPQRIAAAVVPEADGWASTRLWPSGWPDPLPESCQGVDAAAAALAQLLDPPPSTMPGMRPLVWTLGVAECAP